MLVQIVSAGHAGDDLVVLHCYRDCRCHMMSALRTHVEHRGYAGRQTLRHALARRRHRYFDGVLCHARAYIRIRMYLHRVTIMVTNTRELVSTERATCIDVRSDFV